MRELQLIIIYFVSVLKWFLLIQLYYCVWWYIQTSQLVWWYIRMYIVVIDSEQEKFKWQARVYKDTNSSNSVEEAVEWTTILDAISSVKKGHLSCRFACSILIYFKRLPEWKGSGMVQNLGLHLIYLRLKNLNFQLILSMHVADLGYGKTWRYVKCLVEYAIWKDVLKGSAIGNGWW